MKKTMKIAISIILAIALNFSLVGMASAAILEFADEMSTNAADTLTYSTWTGTASSGTGHFTYNTSTKECHIYSASGWGFFIHPDHAPTYSTYKVYLECNIDFNRTSNVGCYGVDFGGTFYGQGHTIKGINIQQGSSDWGLFRYFVGGAKIYDLNLDYMRVFASGSSKNKTTSVGAVVGWVKSSSTLCEFKNINVTSNNGKTGLSTYNGNIGAIAGTTESPTYFENCTAVATIADEDYGDDCGGLVGYAKNAIEFKDCSFSGSMNTTLNNKAHIGGMVGRVDGTLKCTGCTNYSTFSAGAQVGGMAGYPTGATTIINCTNKGNITCPNSDLGGMVGNCSSSLEIRDCTNDGILYSSSTAVGGMFGYCKGSPITVTDCTNNAQIGNVASSGDRHGGMAGTCDTNGNVTFTRCTNNGQIYGAAHAAGIVSISEGVTNISECKNYGNIGSTSYKAGRYSAGIISYIRDDESYIDKCYNYRPIVSSSSDIGGILGESESAVMNITNCENGTPGTSYTITGTDRTGGIVGYLRADASDANHNTGSNCKNYMAITGKACVGGIFGQNGGHGDWENLYNYARVTGSSDRVAGIFGQIDDDENDIINCGNEANVSGAGRVGGIVGNSGGVSASNYLYTLRDCYNKGNISSTAANVGGIYGCIDQTSNDPCARFFNCTNSGSVTCTVSNADASVGGIMGNLYTDAKNQTTLYHYFEKCVNTGAVTASSGRGVGGIVGKTVGVTKMKDCENTATILAGAGVNYSRAGGMVGYNDDDAIALTGCKNSGNVSGNEVGGMIGYTHAAATLDTCTNSGNITDNYTSTNQYGTGGMIGYIDGNSVFTDCSSTGTIKGYYGTGGILGYSSTGTTTMTRTFNTGDIQSRASGTSYSGGLAGYTKGANTFTLCYNGNGTTGSINTSSYPALSAGGLLGYSTGATTISYCYNNGPAVYAGTNSASYAGGLVGDCSTTVTIKASYSAAKTMTGTAKKTLSGRTTPTCTTALALAISGATSQGTSVTEANLKGTTYLTTSYLNRNCSAYSGDEGNNFIADGSGRNAGFPVLACFGDPFEPNAQGAWEIRSTSHWQSFVDKVNSGITFLGETVKLTADIDISKTNGFAGGNGSNAKKFMGTFDGDNHTISNYKVSGTADYAGLFGYIDGATIKNITLSNITTESTNAYAGVLVGYANGTCKISNVTLDGCKVTATGKNYVGGFVGYANGTTSFADITITSGITVTGAQGTGGVIGYSSTSPSVNGVTVTGTVTVNGTQRVGGILGETPQNFSINNVEFKASSPLNVIGSSSYIGGLVGLADGTNAVSLSNVKLPSAVDVHSTGSGDSVGGIVGRSDGNLEVSNVTFGSTLKVYSTGGSYVGGVVGGHGSASGTTTVSNITFSGAVSVYTTGKFVAGVVGYSKSNTTVTDVTASSSIDVSCGTSGTTVSGSGESFGGLVGYSGGTTTINGTVTLNGNVYINTNGAYVGGLVGRSANTTSITGVNAKRIGVHYWSYNTSTSTDAGGFVGRVENGTAAATNSTVTTMTIEAKGNSRGGVFGSVSGAVSISGVTINSLVIGATSNLAAENVGGFVGYTTGKTTISNSSIPKLEIYSSSGDIGGIIGEGKGLSASGVEIAKVSIVGAGSHIGGFVGLSDESTNNISFTGTNSIGSLSITATTGSYIAGVVGYAGGSVTALDTVSVPSTFTFVGTADESNSRIAAVIGYAGSANISGFNFDSITIGSPDKKRVECYSGGFVGQVSSNLTVKNCSAGNVKLYGGSEFTSGGTFSHSKSKSWIGGVSGAVGSVALIENVTLGSLTLTSKGYDVGGIIGTVGSTTTLKNVKILDNNSSITVESWDTGAMVGYSTGAFEATDCENHASISFLNETGFDNGDSLATIGGILGRANSTAKMTNCKNYGNVTVKLNGYESTGGLVGCVNSTGTFLNCENYGTISSTGEYVGGIAGRIGGASTFTNCANKGAVSSTDVRAAGLVGTAGGVATISKSYNTAAISGRSSIGGIVGYISGVTLTDVYNTGAITADASGNYYAAGLVGEDTASTSSVKYCYNAGTVTGCSNASYIGTLVGRTTPATIQRSYYLDGSMKMATYAQQGTSVTSSTLKSRAMVSKNGQFLGDGNWVLDSANTNGGYPVYGTGVEYKYMVTFDNLFNLNSWQNSISNKLNNTGSNTVTVNESTNSIAVTTGAGSSGSDIYTVYGASPEFYNIPVKPNTEYVITMDVTTGTQAQYFVFNYDSSYKAITSDTRGGSSSYSDANAILTCEYPTSNKTVNKTFVTTDKTAYIQLRFGNANAKGQTSEFKNIRIYENAAPYKDVTSTSYGKFCAYSSTTLGTLPTPTRTGYTFDGWYTAPNGGGTKVTSSTATMLDDTALYSNWTVNKYQVTWETDGDALTGTYTKGLVPYGTPIVSPNTPTKTGYTFVGWSPSVDTTVPDHAVTYTAQWTINKYDVTFKNYDGTVLETKKCDYNTVPTYTGATPTKVSDADYHYSFKDWTPTVSAVTVEVTYTATFTATAHSLGDYINDGDAGHYKECADCGYKTATAAHNLGVFISDGASGHHKLCADCGYTTTVVSHNMELKTVDDGHWDKCKDCGFDGPKTSHTTKLCADKTGHWYESEDGCGFKSGVSSHSLITAKNDKQHYQYCTHCKFAFDYEDHDYKVTANYNDKQHEFVCEGCGNVYWEEHSIKHDGSGECEICNYKVGNVAEYELVKAALKKVPSEPEQNVFFVDDEKMEYLKAAVASVKWGKTSAEQDIVNAYAAEIEQAIENLTIKTYPVTLPSDCTLRYDRITNTNHYMMATISAPATDGSGQKFAYWVDESGNVASTYRNYTFVSCTPRTFTPVYGTVTEDKYVATSVLDVRDNLDGTYSILVEHSASSKISINAHGALFTYDSGSKSNLEWKTEDTKVYDYSASKTAATRTGLLEIKINAPATTSNLYVKSYVLVDDTPVYSPTTKTFTLKPAAGTNGVSQSVVSEVGTSNNTDGPSDTPTDDANGSAKLTFMDIVKMIVEFFKSLIKMIDIK